MNSTRGQRGVTLVELLVALAVTSLVTGAGLVMVRSSATLGRDAATSAMDSAGVVSVVRAMDELRSAIVVLEARADSVTAVISSVSSGATVAHRDPATGREVTLGGYVVRYAFANGVLTRDTGRWLENGWTMDNQPQVVARLAMLQLNYANRDGNETWAPSEVVAIFVSHATSGGARTTASAFIAGTAAGRVAATTWVAANLPPEYWLPEGPPGRIVDIGYGILIWLEWEYDMPDHYYR